MYYWRGAKLDYTNAIINCDGKQETHMLTVPSEIITMYQDGDDDTKLYGKKELD